MRMSKWLRSLIPLLAIVALVVAGCGGQPARQEPARQEQANQQPAAPAQQSAAAPAQQPAQIPAKIKLGLSVANTFEFLPAYVAEDKGYWKKRNLEVEIIALPGDSKLHEAMAAKSIDVGLGSSGGAAAAILRGVPETIVAALDDSLKLFVLIVNNDIKDVKDLKGKTIGITAPGSLTEFVMRTLAKNQGWQKDDIKLLPLGSFQPNMAAFKTGQTQGFVWTYDGGYTVIEQGLGKVLLSFGDVLPEFIFEVVIAQNDLIQNKPDVVQRFLAGLYEAIAFMKANKDYTVDIFEKKMQFNKAVGTKVYDFIMGNMSLDGTFSDTKMQGVAESLVSQGVTDKAPQLEKIVTKKFLPVKP